MNTFIPTANNKLLLPKNPPGSERGYHLIAPKPPVIIGLKYCHEITYVNIPQVKTGEDLGEFVRYDKKISVARIYCLHREGDDGSGAGTIENPCRSFLHAAEFLSCVYKHICVDALQIVILPESDTCDLGGLADYTWGENWIIGDIDAAQKTSVILRKSVTEGDVTFVLFSNLDITIPSDAYHNILPTIHKCSVNSDAETRCTIGSLGYGVSILDSNIKAVYAHCYGGVVDSDLIVSGVYAPYISGSKINAKKSSYSTTIRININTLSGSFVQYIPEVETAMVPILIESELIKNSKIYNCLIQCQNIFDSTVECAMTFVECRGVCLLRVSELCVDTQIKFHATSLIKGDDDGYDLSFSNVAAIDSYGDTVFSNTEADCQLTILPRNGEKSRGAWLSCNIASDGKCLLGCQKGHFNFSPYEVPVNYKFDCDSIWSPPTLT